MNDLKVCWWPIVKPIPYVRNSRKIPEGAIDKVAASIQEFGWRQSIVVDKDGVIICGHTRLLAAKKLRLQEVPVHVADNLTPAQVKAYRLMDNRSHEETDWDLELLGLELEELQGLDFDLGLTGFDDDELAAFLAEKTEGLTDEDDAPAVMDFAITEPGDLWLLGKHRLLCGDATVITDVERLMAGLKADMVFTDPPYNVDYVGKTKDALKIQNDKKSDVHFRQFLVDAFTAIATSTKPGAAAYICHSDSEGFNFRGAFIEAGFEMKQCLIWNKNSLVMGRQDYHWKHEPILYGWQAGAAHSWHGDRTQTTVWDINRPSRSTEHPTMKPVELINRALSNSTKEGDLVLDTFGGSGSTLIACAKTGREARVVELDPHYCDVIVKRWQDFTGQQATLEADGRTLEQVKAARVGVAA